MNHSTLAAYKALATAVADFLSEVPPAGADAVLADRLTELDQAIEEDHTADTVL